jgi:integrase
MEDTEEIFDSTPPELQNAIQSATTEIIPQKSAAEYQKIYAEFFDFLKAKKTTQISDNILLAYLKASVFGSGDSLNQLKILLTDCFF